MRRRKTRNISASAVLVTVTGNQSDEEVVRLACGMVDPKKGRLHILYVIEVERGLPVDAEIGPATAKDLGKRRCTTFPEEHVSTKFPEVHALTA